MKLGLIGLGRWGKIYLKNLETYFPNIKIEIGNRNNWQDIKADGVIIATPPDSHVLIAKHFLDQNIPTLIEKPISLSYDEANQLSIYKSPILVNNIHLFSECYQQFKKIYQDNPTNISSTGFNLGPTRSYSTLYDYTHDLSMIIDLCGMPNKSNAHYIKKNDLGALIEIELEYDKFKTKSIIGNLGEYKSRTLETNSLNYYETDSKYLSFKEEIILKETKSTLKNVLDIFINAIEEKVDNRLGLDLSLKMMTVMEELSLQL